jgi:hypothetical protein
VKHLAEPDRAQLIASLMLYYNDEGGMWSPQISRRRKRVTIDGVEFWLVRVPKRCQYVVARATESEPALPMQQWKEVQKLLLFR